MAPFGGMRVSVKYSAGGGVVSGISGPVRAGQASSRNSRENYWRSSFLCFLTLGEGLQLLVLPAESQLP